jgi:hypothetical protein
MLKGSSGKLRFPERSAAMSGGMRPRQNCVEVVTESSDLETRI